MQRHVLGSCSVEYNIVPSVRQLALTDGLSICHLINRVNDQSQGDYGVAAIGGLQGDYLSFGGVEGDAVPYVRHSIWADSFFVCCLVEIGDGQNHSYDGVAAVGGLQSNFLRVGSIEGNSVPYVRQSTLADSLGIVHVVGRIDVQCHGDHGVTAIDSLQGHVLRSCSVEYNVVPSIRQFALADGLGIAHVVGRVDNQGHSYHGVTAIDSLQGHVLRPCSVEYNVVPCIGQFALADGLGIAHVVGRVDNQGHSYHGVTAVGGL